jgi:hypothetical protein
VLFIFHPLSRYLCYIKTVCVVSLLFTSPHRYSPFSITSNPENCARGPTAVCLNAKDNRLSFIPGRENPTMIPEPSSYLGEFAQPGGIGHGARSGLGSGSFWWISDHQPLCSSLSLEVDSFKGWMSRYYLEPTVSTFPGEGGRRVQLNGVWNFTLRMHIPFFFTRRVSQLGRNSPR